MQKENLVEYRVSRHNFTSALIVLIFSLVSILVTISSFEYTIAQEETRVNTSSQAELNNTTQREQAKHNNYFIFPSQKTFFSHGVNATKQADIAMLEGKWKVEQSREIANGLKSLVKSEDKPKMASIKEYNVPGLDENEILLRIYDPGVNLTKKSPMLSSSPVLIFVHGGGWAIGDVDVYDDSIRHLANSSGMIVAAMNYRLAPEHPFPAGLRDVISAVNWIANNGEKIGVNPKRIALGGDSVGANLALAAAISLRDSGNNTKQEDKGQQQQHSGLLDVLYLLYGPYSPELLNRNSMNIFGNGEFGLSYAQMKWAMNQTFQNASDYDNPLAFPLLAQNLAGLPPIYLAAMGLDPLKDESIELANRLKKEGQEHYLTIWPGVAHGALSLIPITPEIQEYVDAMAVYLRGVLHN